MAKNTATGAETAKETSLSRTRNMRSFITPIFQNAGIRIRTIKHWFTAWDCRKIPDEM